ncbi:amino acid permease [Candidatus Sumerlaeota bacterium]|nr:amino acid permease [Candidatus Sumerlaeota bacterium]
MDKPELKQGIGLGGAVFTLVGFVIGMAIFILPGELVAKTGPGLFVAFLAAGLLALFSCVVAAQIGAIIPLSGAGYIAASSVISPFLGFMLVCMIMVCLVVGMPFMGFGFADYFEVLWPGLNRTAVAVASIIGFGCINLLGVRAAVSVQALMVILLVAVLLVVGFGGVAHMNPALMHPLFPKGAGPLIEASIPAYFCYAGFMVIVEISGELDRPERTVPWSLGISLAIIVGLYLLISIALPGLKPWAEYEGTKAPLADAAKLFLPSWFPAFIAVSAVFGAATSINAWFMTQTRDIHAMAHDKVLPEILAHKSKRFDEPDAAIIFAIALAVLGVFLGATPEEYSIMVVLALMFIQMMSGLVIILAQARLPREFAQATIQLSAPWRWFFGMGFTLLSLAFMVIGVMQSLKCTVILIGLSGVGAVYYFIRRDVLRKRGVSIEEMLKKDLAKVIKKS